MGGSTAPVVWAGVGEGCIAVDFGGNQHGFIAREDGLAERDDTVSIVDDTDIGVCRLAVGLVREGFRNASTIIAV